MTKQASHPPSLASRVLLRVLPPTAAVLIVLGVIFLLLNQRAAQSQISVRLEQMMEHSRDLLRESIESAKAQAATLAANDLVINGLVDAQDRSGYLPALFRSLGAVAGTEARARFSLLDFQGREILSNDLPGLDLEAANLAAKTPAALARKRDVLRLDSQGLFYAAPVFVHGFAEGAVAISMQSPAVHALLQGWQRLEHAAALVAPEGDILYANQAYQTQAGDQRIDDSARWVAVREGVAIAGLDRFDLLVGIAHSEAYAGARILRQQLVVIQFAALLAIVAAIVAATRLTIRPVSRMGRDLEKVAANKDLGARLSFQGPAELQTLTASFNRTLDALEGAYTSKDRLDQLMAGSPAVIYSYVLDQGRPRLRYISNNVRQILGHAPEVFINSMEYWQGCVHPEDLPLLTDKLAGAASRDEYRFRNAQGRYHWLSDQQKPVAGRDGTMEVVGAWWDVTDQRRVNEALRESERQFRSLFMESPVSIIIHDRDSGAIIDANPAACAMYGLSTVEELQANDFWLDPPHSFADALALIRKAAAQGPQQFEWLNRKVDGRLFWEQVHLSPVIINGQERVLATTIDITERRQAEDDIKRQAGLITSLLDSTPDLIFYKDVQGVYLGCNNEFAAHVGRPKDEIVGRTDYDLYPAQEADFYRENDRRMLEQAGPRHNEEWIAYPDGRRVLLDTLKIPYLDADGKLIGALAISRDITERKQAEVAIQESKRRLDMFFSQSLIGFFFMMLDEPIVWNDEADKEALLDYVMANQRMTKVNQALLDQYGARVEDFIGLTPQDLFAHDLEHGRHIWKGLFDQGRWHVETREQRLDGTPIVVDGDYICLYDDQGRITGHFGVQTDITDRRRAEQALREKSEELDRYFTTSLDLLCIANTEGEFLRLNPEWESVLGYSIADLEGRRFLDFVHPEDMDATLAAIARLSQEEQVLNFENRYRCKDGSYRWIEWRSTPRDGLIYAVARDITERRRVEDELRLTGQELARSNADLEQFAYAVSHDMRQPLRMVSSYLQLLEKDLGEKLDQDVREYLHFAVDGARRMDAMILSLLDYSRVGRKTDPKAWMDSREALDEALAFLQPDVRETGAKVQVMGTWPRVCASRDELTRLFQNLVGNALKYQAQDAVPAVSVEVAEKDHAWLFCVRDNGIGIEPSQIDRLFKVFSRLHARTRYEGTGVGLALCRKIVEHHGGTIWAESAGTGTGSVVWFTLPREQEDTAQR